MRGHYLSKLKSSRSVGTRMPCLATPLIRVEVRTDCKIHSFIMQTLLLFCSARRCSTRM